MGTQNGSKLEIWPERILIYALELKLWPFEVFLYVCIGSHAFAMFSMWGAGPRAHINVTTITYFTQNCCISCLFALYGSTTHPARPCGGFWTIFFLLSGLVSLKKKQNRMLIGRVRLNGHRRLMIECLVNRGILVDGERLQDTECPVSIGLVNAERRLQRDRINRG